MNKKDFTSPVFGNGNLFPTDIVIRGVDNYHFVMVLRTESSGFYCRKNQLEDGREWIEKGFDFYNAGMLDWRNIFGPFFTALRIVELKNNNEWAAYYYNHLWCIEARGCSWSGALHFLEKKIQQQLAFLGA